MNQYHKEIFIQHMDDAIVRDQLVGCTAKDWWSNITPKLDRQFPELNLPDYQMTRAQLKQFCHVNSGATDLECAIMIMSWGGQRLNHGITSFNSFKAIKPIISDMRKNMIDHLEAYCKFHKIWREKRIGLGAAYFTKLIFFCEPRHKGYIMDQWIGKSVNLLAGEEKIRLDGAGSVTIRNTLENYRECCQFIEKLAGELRKTGEEIEIAMFSEGGHAKRPWRQHVFEQTGGKAS